MRTVTVSSAPALPPATAANVGWEPWPHFSAICAWMMVRSLVAGAGARGSDKRGGGVVKVNVDDVPVLSPEGDASTLALHDALEALSLVAPRQAKVVELR